MARGDDARTGDPGGDGIQAQRPPRPGLIPAAAALLAALGLALHPALSAMSSHAWLFAGLGTLSVVLLASGLAWRAPTAVAWSLLLLAAEYAAWLATRGAEVDARSPLYAAGLLLTAELAFDGLERTAARPEGEVVARRGLQLAALAVAAIAASTIVLAAATIPVGGSVGLTAAGVAAATLVLVLVVRLHR